MTRWLYLGLILLVVFQRMTELRLAKRNERLARAAGATEFGAGHYPVMVTLHTLFLIACVAEVLDRHGAAAKTRSYLEKLWSFLRSHAAEPGAERPASEATGSQASELPSRRRIAQLLSIPRDRLSGLLVTLGGFVKDCQAAISGNPQLRGS